MSEWIDATRVGLCLVGLTVAAYTDLKTREVPNELWYGVGAAALVLMGLDFNERFGGQAWLLVVPVALVFVVVVTGFEILPVFPEDAQIPEDVELTPRQSFLYRLDLALSAVFVVLALLIFAFASRLDLGAPVFFLAGPQAMAYSACLMMGLALLMFYTSLIAGGADMKALVVLAALFPSVPALQGLPVLQPSAMALLIVPFAIAVFFNGALILVLAKLPVYPVMSARRGHLQLPAALAGYPKAPSEVDLSREWINGKLVDGAFRPTLMPTHEAHSDENQKALLEFLKAKGEPFVFVQPRLPFMVYLLAGFIGALVLSSPLYFLGG